MAEARDHIPEGFVSLQDAFREHHRQRFGFNPTFTLSGVTTDEYVATQNEFLRALGAGHLQALYRPPAATENFVISAEEWKSGEFSESAIHHEPLPAWHAHAGRTAFVNNAQFRNWSMALVGRMVKGGASDPMEMQDWTLGQTVAWIAWRDATALMIFERDDGLVHGFLDALESFERTSSLPTFLSVETAFGELRDRCSAGVLNANGLTESSMGNSEPVSIAKEEWRYLDPYEPEGIHFGKVDAVCVRNSPAPKYWDVTFGRGDVLSVWHRGAASGGKGKERPAPTTAARKRGARHRYAWPDFEAAVKGHLDDVGGIAPSVDPEFNQASVERWARNWCHKNWGKEPSESTVRAHVRPAIDQYETARADKADKADK